jgi:hypothetical protein
MTNGVDHDTELDVPYAASSPNLRTRVANVVVANYTEWNCKFI